MFEAMRQQTRYVILYKDLRWTKLLDVPDQAGDWWRFFLFPGVNFAPSHEESPLSVSWFLAQKVSISMAASKHTTSSMQDHANFPTIHISYECILREHVRESASYTYEVACSITHLAPSAHLSIRITGQNTYRNTATREVPFTRYEAGAATYAELLAAEQLEIRVVEQEGSYCKAFYAVQGQDLIVSHLRHIVSTIDQIAAPSEALA